MFKTSKSVQVIYDGNPCHRLTVTPKQITIKLKDPCTPDEQMKVMSFFYHVAEDLEKATVPFRGALNVKKFSMTMWNDSRTQSKPYTYKE